MATHGEQIKAAYKRDDNSWIKLARMLANFDVWAQLWHLSVNFWSASFNRKAIKMKTACMQIICHKCRSIQTETNHQQ